jgi:hypothetical protein
VFEGDTGVTLDFMIRLGKGDIRVTLKGVTAVTLGVTFVTSE